MSHATAPLLPITSEQARYRYRWLVFIVMLIGEIMDVLDISILNVAGPAIEYSLGASSTQLQWAIGGYVLAMGAGLIIGGRLGDVYGKRRMLLLALLSFTITSLICAIAPSIEILIIGRLLQGLSGAMLLPQGFALLRSVFEADELAKAMAIFGPVLGIAAISGPVVGGALVEANLFGLGWRSALAINIPISLIALVLAWRFVPSDSEYHHTKDIDILGAFLIAIASGLLVYPLIEGQESGWTFSCWVSLVMAAIGFILFVLQQRRQVRHSHVPLIEPSVFSKMTFNVGLLSMALFFSAFIGMQLVFILFLQLGQNFSAGQAGLAALPITIGNFIGSGLAGAILLERMGRRVLQLGAILQLCASVWTGLVIWLHGFMFWQLVPAFIVAGLGSGLIIASLITLILNAVDDRETGSSAGLLASVQAISSAIGIALLSGLFFSQFYLNKAVTGYLLALGVQALFTLVFFIVTFFFPSKLLSDSSH